MICRSGVCDKLQVHLDVTLQYWTGKVALGGALHANLFRKETLFIGMLIFLFLLIFYYFFLCTWFVHHLQDVNSSVQWNIGKAVELVASRPEVCISTFAFVVMSYSGVQV